MKHVRRRLHRYHFHLRVITAVFLLLIASTLAVLSVYFVDQLSYPRVAAGTYLRGTSYDGINSRTQTYQDHGAQYFIEYPNTGVGRIDSTVAQYIDSMRDTLSESMSDPLMTGFRGEFNATYLVRSANREYISIVAQVNITYPMGTLTHDAMYWTFNRQTGETINLSALFGERSTDGIARTLLYIRQELRDQASKRHETISDESLDILVTPQIITNFLVRDRHTLEFVFGQGHVANASLGLVTVTVSTDRLQLFMQNPTARRIFEVTQVSDTRAAGQQASGECARTKCIALTFDDGPGPYTVELLDILKTKGVHATFFDIGVNARRYPTLVKRQFDEGHTIGNHSYNHPSLTMISDAAITRELTTTNDVLRSITGRTPRFVRPPNGAINSHVAQLVGGQGMASVLWSVDTRDWADRNSTIIYNRIIAGARPGAIIILHDIHHTSVDAAAKSIDKLQAQGYRFVTLDELLSNAEPGKIYSNL